MAASKWKAGGDGVAWPLARYPCPADVGLCLIHLRPGMSAEAAGLRLLDMDERRRAARFRRPDDALRHIATRARLRLCLAPILGVSPHALRFVNDGNGRPMLAGEHAGRLDFNLSHSGTFGLIAWSAVRRVGVDIEQRQSAWQWQALCDSVCGEADRQWLERQPVSRRAARFHDLWAAKEAMLKAEGRGLPGGLAHFSIAPRRGPACRGPRDLASPLLTPTNEGCEPFALRSFRALWLRGIAGYAACVSWSIDRGGTSIA